MASLHSISTRNSPIYRSISPAPQVCRILEDSRVSRLARSTEISKADWSPRTGKVDEFVDRMNNYSLRVCVCVCVCLSYEKKFLIK